MDGSAKTMFSVSEVCESLQMSKYTCSDFAVTSVITQRVIYILLLFAPVGNNNVIVCDR